MFVYVWQSVFACVCGPAHPRVCNHVHMRVCVHTRACFQRRKLTVECGGPSGKKHSFMTESSKIAQYLLSLCSAQHKFDSEMTSRQLNQSTATQAMHGPPGGAGMQGEYGA